MKIINQISLHVSLSPPATLILFVLYLIRLHLRCASCKPRPIAIYILNHTAFRQLCR